MRESCATFKAEIHIGVSLSFFLKKVDVLTESLLTHFFFTFNFFL